MLSRRSRRPAGHLAVIVLLLLVQFALRVHDPLALPSFVDESYHATRGGFVYHFDRNPASFSQGKLLFYYWLGLFGPHGDGALGVSRLAVALWSLITSAAVAAAASALFGRRAVIPALLFYALVPWAVFFERMALADPFAGGMAALTAWQSIRLAQAVRPSAAHGVLVGLLAALTLFAKLTTIFIAGLPLAAALLLSDLRPADHSPRALGAWIAALWRHYRRAWIPMVGAGLSLWGLYFAAMLAYARTGAQPKFFTRDLMVGGAPHSNGLLDNLYQLADGAAYLISTPLALGLIALAGVLLRVWRREGAFAVIWLAALWGPITLLGNPVKTRYLMTGVAAAAVIFGGGMAALSSGQPVPAVLPLASFKTGARLYIYSPLYRFEDDMSNAQVFNALARAGVMIFTLGVLVAWVFSFALPFDRTAGTNPAALEMPSLDRYTYLSGPDTGWGMREALAYLEMHGTRVNGQVPAVAVIVHCASTDLYVTPGFAWTCADFRDAADRWETLADVRRWTPLHAGLIAWPFVYLITEFNGTVPPDAPPETVPLDWELVFTAPRPNGGRIVTVWRVMPDSTPPPLPGSLVWAKDAPQRYREH